MRHGRTYTRQVLNRRVADDRSATLLRAMIGKIDDYALLRIDSPAYDDPTNASNPLALASWYDWTRWIGAKHPEQYSWNLAAVTSRGSVIKANESESLRALTATVLAAEDTIHGSRLGGVATHFYAESFEDDLSGVMGLCLIDHEMTLPPSICIDPQTHPAHALYILLHELAHIPTPEFPGVGGHDRQHKARLAVILANHFNTAHAYWSDSLTALLHEEDGGMLNEVWAALTV